MMMESGFWTGRQIKGFPVQKGVDGVFFYGIAYSGLFSWQSIVYRMKDTFVKNIKYEGNITENICFLRGADICTILEYKKLSRKNIILVDFVLLKCYVFTKKYMSIILLFCMSI